MTWFKANIQVATNGKGMYSITDPVKALFREWKVNEGMCFIYCPHTSASLVISESYDPSAKRDMETYFEKAVPENEPWYTHTTEGEDDAPSHIRAMMTPVSLSIPVDNGKLSLGMWQGIYLFEHRAHKHTREVYIRVMDAKGLTE